jgi:hypothetical protein
MGRKLRLLKNNFTSGELDPQLNMRTDIKHYYTGAEEMTDVLVKPQGGYRRRDGLEYIDDLTAYIANDNAVKFYYFTPEVGDTYMLIFLDTMIKVVKDGAIVHTITSTPWLTTHLKKLSFAQAGDTLIVFNRNIQTHRILRITDTNWTVSAITFDAIPKYDYAPTSSTPAQTLTPSAVSGQITLTAGGAIFSAADVGQKIVINGGLIRITTYTSTTVVSGYAEIPLNNTTAAASGAWTLKAGYEDAWSVTRGWPVCGCFHGGRLFVAGGPRPSTIWGSRISEYFDFKLLGGLDDEPCEVTLGEGLNDIVNIVSLTDLLVFTVDGEYAEQNSPITPNNFAPRAQTNRGSEPNTPTLELEGSMLFIQLKGKAIREFYVPDNQTRYIDDNLTLLASHLVNTPTSFVKRKASSTEENDLIYIRNADSTLNVCSVVRSQEVVAWCRVSTAGLFIECGIDDDEVYVCVKRVIDGETKYLLERFNDDYVMDCSRRVTAGLPSVSVTAAHLPNTEVTVFADDADLGEITLNGSGVGTISRNATDYYEVGLNFIPDVLTMPIEQELQEGTTIGRKKRIIEATIQLKDTTYIELNGQRLSFRTFGPAGGGSPLDAPPPKFTGRVKKEGFLDYKDVEQLRMTQSRPGFLDVLGISLLVSF